MKRSWLALVTATVSGLFGISESALAGHGGGFHGGGGSFHGGQSGFVQRASFQAPIGHQLSGVKVGNSIGGGVSPMKPTHPSFPKGPVVGPIKPPTGSVKPPSGPIGPIKPPGGTVVGPVKPPVGPIGPIGPVKPPKGPVVGPVKPPVGPIGPIGPINPPGGGGGGGQQPPGGGAGGGGGGGTAGGNPGHCKPCWPSLVLGCLPVGGYGGYYGYYPPVYTQPVVVSAPVTVPGPLAVATPEVPAPSSTTVAAETSAPTTTTTTASGDALPKVPVGSTLTLQAKDLGETGQVLLVMDNLTLGVQVNDWKDDYATATLPLLGITGLTKSEIVLVKADGRAASSVKVDLVPANQSGTEIAAANLNR